MNRTYGVLLGAFTTDSLALGAHWEYDQARIAATLGEVRELLPPTLNTYHAGKKAGDQSHYGDQALLLLRSTREHSRFDLTAFATAWRNMMSTYTGYMDHATKDTLANLARGASPSSSGATTSDFSGPARLVALLPLYYPATADEAAPPTPEMLQSFVPDQLQSFVRDQLQSFVQDAQAQTLFSHNNPTLAQIAEFFTHALAALFQGADMPTAFTTAAALPYSTLPAQDWLAFADMHLGKDPLAAVAAMGQSCGAQGAMQSVLFLAQHFENSPKQGLISNVMAGGDSCARGLMLGALFGARHGAGWIPAQWVNGLAAKDEIYNTTFFQGALPPGSPHGM